MSFVIAKRKLASTYVFDMDDANDVLQPYADAMNGGLNEHNWTNGAFEAIVTNGLAQADFAIGTVDDITAIDPHVAVGSQTLIAQSTSWTPVDCNGAEVDWDSDGGKSLVTFSFQMKQLPGLLIRYSGLVFAIEVDGVIQNAGLLGTGDMNDAFDALASPLGAGAIPVATDMGFMYNSSPSIRASMTPVTVSVAVTLLPGKHIARLMTRNLYAASGGTYQYMSNCEGYVLDLWA